MSVHTLLAQAQEPVQVVVEKDGGTPWLVLVIGAVAVVAAAVITARVSYVNHRVSLKAEGERATKLIDAEHRRATDRLDAEKERLEEQLAAERKRLAQQLLHDRQLNDLAELRTMLDSIIGDVFESHRLYVLLELQYESLKPLEEQAEKDGPNEELLEERVKLGNLRTEFADRNREVLWHWMRLRARLTEEHPVAESLDAAQMRLTKLPLPEQRRPASNDELAAMDKGSTQAFSKLEEFTNECRSLMGWQLPD